MNYRYERKFFISQLRRKDVELLVKFHPAMFSEIYQQRRVNNIYFDTPALKYYYDNVDGTSQRKKVRLRWYGELSETIDKPVLEIKNKKELLGYKDSFTVKKFKIGTPLKECEFETMAEQSGPSGNLMEELKNLRPVLINGYDRKYFLSADKRYRITIDTNLDFYSARHLSRYFWNHRSFDRSGPDVDGVDRVIMEIKYSSENDAEAAEITAHFPFRLTRSSKYVSGVEELEVV
ncbi:MAG: polyphosphate polymerase domain-containing protein [bacterium]|nr:polyphosphate polymerase domain-containing protein [bacterium]